MSNGSDAEEVTNITHVKKGGGRNGSAARLLATLNGSDAKVQPEVREAFLLLDRMFSDRLSEVEAEYESRLRAERQKRKDTEQQEEFRRREEQNARLQKIKDDAEKDQRIFKSIRLNRWGWVCCSFMVLGLGGDRIWQEAIEPKQIDELQQDVGSFKESITGEIELRWAAISNNVFQLDRQVDSFAASQKAAEKQLNLDTFKDNDRFGALLKAVDSLKAQVAEMQWYVNDDTRKIMSELRDFINQQKAQKTTDSEQ